MLWQQSKYRYLEMLQTEDQDTSHTEVSGGSDSYKPRNVTHIWQVAGCEFQDLTVLRTQSVPSLLSPQHWRWWVPSKCDWSWKWSR